MKQALSILKETFGYDTFLPHQEEVIQSILQKKDTLAIMPTGSGKSLCYQIPALIFEGLTVVVSPLISLITDQVMQLKEAGIAAATLNSSLSIEEYQHNLYQIQNQQVKLLYLAPETLLKDNILNIISSMEVSLFAIDEAHCISQWGHDFRPEYRMLARVRKQLVNTTCAAFTATATPRVQQDIVETLEFNEANQFISSFDRKNLFLKVIPKQNPLEQVLEFLKQYPDQSGIIYCFSRKQVEELSSFLHIKGYSVKPYHAGLGDNERKTNQELFIKDDIQIIVATIAFGMGINKPNVRFVVHYDLPKNLESYYQEIGRAGRDGLDASCLLLYNPGDTYKVRYFIDQKEESERRIALIHLNAMVSYAEANICRRIPLLHYFGEKVSQKECGQCDNCTEEKKAEEDITVAAQKFLSCVKRTGERFGAHHIIDVLRGSQSQKILKFNHQTLSTYGIGKEYSKKQWLQLTRQFLQKDLLQQDLEIGHLKLTQKSFAVFKNDLKVTGIIEDETPIKPRNNAKDIDQKHPVNNDLFDILKKERKRIADMTNVPPYIIFSDRSLMEMATYFPQSKDEMMQIHGMGHAKYDHYGESFLWQVREYCKVQQLRPISKGVHKAVKKRDNSTSQRHLIIGKKLTNGSTINQILSEYKIQLQTVLDHIYKYYLDGHSIQTIDLQPFTKVTHDKQFAVFCAFDQHGHIRLKPVYDQLKGTLDYDELKILRLIYLGNKKQNTEK